MLKKRFFTHSNRVFSFKQISNFVRKLSRKVNLNIFSDFLPANFYFIKMDQTRPLFVYFCSFHNGRTIVAKLIKV